MEIYYPMRPGSLGIRSSRPKQLNVPGKTSTKSLMMKTWDSFMECITFHLQQVFRHDTGEALKYYITNTLRKPNRIPIHQFLAHVKQLNHYLETLPCLYYSPSMNQATKHVLPLDDTNLAMHLLRMCPVKWQTQHDLTEKTTPVNTGPFY